MRHAVIAFIPCLVIITQIFIIQINSATYSKKRFEIGPLLSDDDATKVILEYDDEDGIPSSSGVRTRYSPLVVLNRLHELAFDLAHFQYNDCFDLHVLPTSTSRAIFHQKISDQINILFEAFGAMERIQATPLPFAYVVHLRSFLIIYLFLINLIGVAKHEWVVSNAFSVVVSRLLVKNLLNNHLIALPSTVVTNPLLI